KNQSIPMGSWERTPFVYEAVADSCSNSNVNNNSATPPGSKQGLSQSSRPHDRFHHCRGNLREAILHRQAAPPNSLTARDVSLQVNQLCHADTNSQHLVSQPGSLLHQQFCKSERIRQDQLTFAFCLGWNDLLGQHLTIRH